MPQIVSLLNRFSVVAFAIGASAVAVAHILDTAGMEPVKSTPKP